MKVHPWLEGAKFPESLPLSSLQPELVDEPSDVDDKEAQLMLSNLGRLVLTQGVLIFALLFLRRSLSALHNYKYCCLYLGQC